jgi:hypothetical protein
MTLFEQLVYESMEKYIVKDILCEDGSYQTKILLKKSYNPGHSGFSYRGYRYCYHCEGSHNTILCPYKQYYHVLV